MLTACGIETLHISFVRCYPHRNVLQQHLPLVVCDEGCGAAEERNDDEDRTSLVPDQREGETKRMEQQHLPLAVLKRFFDNGM